VAARWDTPKSTSTWARRGGSNAPIAADCTSCAKAPGVELVPPHTLSEASAVKQLGEGWDWREVFVGDRFITYGRTLFEADLLNFVTLCGFSEELLPTRNISAATRPCAAGIPCRAPWSTPWPRGW